MTETVDINRLAAAAKAGDADAQYRIAAMLAGEGHKDAAVKMLRKSAAAGHLDARFTLANFTLIGHLVPRNPQHAADILSQAASKDHPASMRLFSVLQAIGHGTDMDWPSAVKLLVKGASLGHAAAMCELAVLRGLYGFRDDLNESLLMAAATRGHVVAMMHLVQDHIDGAPSISADVARNWANQAQGAGHPLAAGFIKLLGDGDLASPPPPSALPGVPEDVASDLATQPEATARPKAKVLSDRPHVESIEGLFSRQLCQHIVAQAAPSLAPARFIDPATGEQQADPHRHCHAMTFWPSDLDLPVVAAGARMCAAAGGEPKNGEMMNVFLHQEGMYDDPHYDWFYAGAAGTVDEREAAPQRKQTVMVTLSNDFEGGDTKLSRTNLSVQGQVGDALIVHNILADGEVDEQALQETAPVTAGEKWTMIKWTRENSYRF